MEIILLYYVADPIKLYIYFFGYFCFDVPFTMLFSAVLSVATGVGGYEWPISARSVFMDVAF